MAFKPVVIQKQSIEATLRACIATPLVVEVAGLPPSVNRIWRHSGGKVYKTKEATGWDALAQMRIKQKARSTYGRWDLSELKGLPLRLDIDFYRPTWRGKTKRTRHLCVRPDASNLIKVAEDALTRALGIEDSAVVELVVRKVQMPGPERTVMRLMFLED